jgi:hypothetical protein
LRLDQGRKAAGFFAGGVLRYSFTLGFSPSMAA